MGKTKTAILSETPKEEKSSEDAYREKKEKQAREAAKAKTEQKSKPEKVHIAGLKGGQRLKIVEAEVPSTETEISTEGASSDGSSKTHREPKVRSKKYKEAKAKVSQSQTYSTNDAVKLAKDTSYSKFDGSIELHLVVKKTGTSVNITLPFSAGKTKRVEVASQETVKKLEKGEVDFDILLAKAEMMPLLVPFARILGPKGLMPNPKNGTIIKNEKDASKFGGNSVSLKTEKDAPLIHTVVGKVSQTDEEVIKNTEAILQALGGSKQILKAYMKPTMGPSVKLIIN